MTDTESSISVTANVISLGAGGSSTVPVLTLYGGSVDFARALGNVIENILSGLEDEKRRRLLSSLIRHQASLPRLTVLTMADWLLLLGSLLSSMERSYEQE